MKILFILFQVNLSFIQEFILKFYFEKTYLIFLNTELKSEIMLPYVIKQRTEIIIKLVCLLKIFSMDFTLT